MPVTSGLARMGTQGKARCRRFFDQRTLLWLALVVVTVGAVVAIDQGSKTMVVRNRGSFDYHYGSDLGLLPWWGYLLAWAVVVLVVVKVLAHPVVLIATGLFIGGSLSNLIDVQRAGKVVDFIRLPFGGLDALLREGAHPYLANSADIAIAVGQLLLVAGLLCLAVRWRRHVRTAAADESVS